jgi:hypothetical protein
LDHFLIFRNLTNLELGLDIEVDADDDDTEYVPRDWYYQNFIKRLEVTEKISKRCPSIQRCEWNQYYLGDDGGFGYHTFVVVEENMASERVRVVKPVVQWWMADYVGKEGLQLPNDMVKEEFLL